MAAAVQSIKGQLTEVRAGALSAHIPLGSLGNWCFVERLNSTEILCRITGFNGTTFALTPYDDIDGVFPGAVVRVALKNETIFTIVPETGRVVDFQGKELSHFNSHILQSAQANARETLCPFSAAPIFSERREVDEQLITGVKSVDNFIPIGKGQRLAIISRPGVGKTTLLISLAQKISADIVVLALIGERGREITETVSLVENSELSKKTVIVISSSDESAGKRALAPYTATAIAEAYQRKGKDVLLIVDSLTRAARAIRDYSLAAGELPVRQGYTASVYSELPVLVERSGNMKHGSITALYSLLQDGPDEFDTLSSELRSLLDGHIILSEEFVKWGIRPAINIFESLSRCTGTLQSEDEIAKLSMLKAKFAKVAERMRMSQLGVADELSTEEKQEFAEFRSYLNS